MRRCWADSGRTDGSDVAVPAGHGQIWNSRRVVHQDRRHEHRPDSPGHHGAAPFPTASGHSCSSCPVRGRYPHRDAASGPDRERCPAPALGALPGAVRYGGACGQPHHPGCRSLPDLCRAGAAGQRSLPPQATSSAVSMAAEPASGAPERGPMTPRLATCLLLPPTMTTRGPLSWVYPPQPDTLKLCREIDVLAAFRVGPRIRRHRRDH